MDTPVVSVVIPTQNRAKMLRRAIESVLAQTWRSFELIVVSDGSKDHTRAVVSSFADPRIRLLEHDAARGASAARNTGIRASVGKYVAFLDDDDEWTPNKLDLQLPVIEDSSPRVGLVYAWMEYLRDGRSIELRAPTLRGSILPEMLDRQAITNSSTLIVKRQVLDVVGGFDEGLPRGNDGDFIRRVSKHYQVDYVPEVLAKVHVGHGPRITSNAITGLQNEIAEHFCRLKRFQSEFDKYPAKKARVLTEIAVDYLKLRQGREALEYVRQGIGNCETCLTKMRLVARFLRAGLSDLRSRLRDGLAGKVRT